MLDRTIRGPAQLLESVRFLSEHRAYREALIAASVWAPQFAGQFDAEQQAELNALLQAAEEGMDIDLPHTNRVELDRSDLQQLEGALDELRDLHDHHADVVDRAASCLCAAASRWRAARRVTDRLRGDLGLRPRVF